MQMPARDAATRGHCRRTMIDVRSRDNGRSAAFQGCPIGVACSCGHRALVPLETIGAHDGDMRRLHDLRFTCSQCGRRGSLQLWFMTSDRDEASFLHPDLRPDPAP
jgi:hypothetical protein